MTEDGAGKIAADGEHSHALMLRFSIRAYDPDRMPMARLSEYLAELASVLGETHAVHFVSLEAGSTVVVHKVDPEAAPKVLGRANAVRRGDGPPDAMKAYYRINTLLRADNANGALSESSGAEIIAFPGRESLGGGFSSVIQQGTIDGEIVRVGGIRTLVPVILREGHRIYANCYANKRLAKMLAQRLFEPVRLFGSGRWSRKDNGEWELERFTIDRFEELREERLTDVITALRSVSGGDWDGSGLDEINVLRHGGETAH